MKTATVSRSEDADKCMTIKIHGAFSFPLYQEFRKACEGVSPQQRIVVDLSESEYMDSSAMGMLLFLREKVGGEKAQIEIANCNATMRRILGIANFDKLFQIS